ncbi:putative transcriptional regulator, bolA family [Serratia symbiotica str. 'Cinara cedri']|nr:putative transcriptional regulator, bolA family [Serratia symbiotica str. 'Cinara cedri']
METDIINNIVIELKIMENKEIKDVLMQALALDQVYVSGDKGHFEVIAIGELFFAMSSIKKQQKIYAPLMEYIMDNRIHALSIKAYTPAEWQEHCNLNKFSLTL